MSISSGHDNDTSLSKNLLLDETEMNLNRLLFLHGFPKEEEFFKRIADITSESQTQGLSQPEAAIWCAVQTASLLEMLDFQDTTYSSGFVSYALDWLEECECDELCEIISPETLINILTKVVVSDTEKSQQKRVLKIFWTQALDLPAELLIRLGKIAIHYTPEVGHEELKEWMQLVEDPEPFLQLYSGADVHTTRFATDPNSTTRNLENECRVKVDLYRDQEKTLVDNYSYRWSDSESLGFLELGRIKTAKECMHRLKQTIRHMSSDTNPHASQLLASVVRDVMSTEIEALSSMNAELELQHQATERLHKLSVKHILAYNALKVDHNMRTFEFFEACHKEKDDAIKDSVYRKAKCLANIEKARISTDVRLTSKDLLKRIVNKAGGALKEAEEKLENSMSSECALCSSNFRSRKMRACFAPCGHARACLPCATRAWRNNPTCPWCKVAVEKPIPLPPKLFF